MTLALWPWLAGLAIVAAVEFTLAWIVLAKISPGFTIFGTHVAPYNSVAQSISGLGLGKTAPLMNAAFVATGALLALAVVGIVAGLPDLSDADRLMISIILLLSPLGIAGCGIFDLEHFMPHFLAFVLAMGMPVLGFALLGWRLLPHAGTELIARALIGAAAITLILLIAYFWSFDPEGSGRGEGIAGALQRVLVTEVLGTFALLGWSVFWGTVT